MRKNEEQAVDAMVPGRLSGVLDNSAPAPSATADGKITLIRVAILGALFIWLHWQLLMWIVQIWQENPNWSHGFLLPLFSLYLLYCRWGELRSLDRTGMLPCRRLGALAHVLAIMLAAVAGIGLWLLLRALAFGAVGAAIGACLSGLLLAALWVWQYGQNNRLVRAFVYGVPCWAGFVLAAFFLLVEILLSVWVPSTWIMGMAMIAMLFGLVMFMNGSRAMRLLWLPILFLCLAIPLPESYYQRMAYPLQEFAAGGAVNLLQAVGVDITRKASTLFLTSTSGHLCELTVAEACSGMRLLMAFFALGVATAYLTNRPLWQRIVMVLAAVPIAVFCNVLRVTITGTMFYIDHPDWGRGILHAVTGMLMLLPAFGMLWVLGWLLQGLRWLGNKLFEVQEQDDEPARITEPQQTAQAGRGEHP